MVSVGSGRRIERKMERLKMPVVTHVSWSQPSMTLVSRALRLIDDSLRSMFECAEASVSR